MKIDNGVIRIPQIDTTYMRVVKGSEYRITLGEKSLEVFSWSNNEYLDEEKQIWEEKFFYNKATIPKLKIGEIDICYVNKEKHWQVQIKPSDNFLIQLATKEEANELYNELAKWINSYQPYY